MNNNIIWNNAENIPPPVENANNVTAQEYSQQKKFCVLLSTLKFQGNMNIEDEVLADAEANLNNVIIYYFNHITIYNVFVYLLS